MEKINSHIFWEKVGCLKCLLIFRYLCLGCVLLCATGATLFDDVFIQKYTIKLDYQNTPVEVVLDAITKQTGIKIAYSNEVLNRKQTVSVKIETTDILVALQAVLGDEYIYKQIEDYIAISKRIKPMSDRPAKNISAIMSMKEPIYIQGLITDGDGNPIIGTNILVKGKSLGTVSDLYGRYQLEVSEGDWLEFRYIGYQVEERAVKKATVINVRMTESQVGLGDIVVVGYGQQKKSSVVSSIQTIGSEDLNVKQRNLTTSIAGRIAGVISVQRSGEPGNDEAEFYIRGQSSYTGGTNPLILVDGVPRTMEDIDVDEIESFTVLKDAAATAVYGAEGANGVVLITSKRGKVQKTMVNFTAQYAIITPSRMPRSLDAVNYLSLYNEALWNDQGNPDKDHFLPEITDEILEKYRSGADPDVYPSVDWTDLLKKQTQSQRYTIHFRGGSEKMRFFVSGAYYAEDGIYRSNAIDKYDANIDLKRFNLRSNIDMTLTKTTQLSVDLSGQYLMKNNPGYSSDLIFSYITHSPTHVIPMFYSDGTASTYSNLGFGHDKQPYNMLNHSGYTKSWTSYLQSKVSLEQKLDFFLKGLSLKGIVGFDTDFGASTKRTKAPKTYFALRRKEDGLLEKKTMEEGTALSDPTKGDTHGAKRIYLEASFNYQHCFAEKHDVSALVLYMQKESQYQQVEGLLRLPYRKQSMVSRLSYNYDSRYIVEASMGATGSENFAEYHRWGVFPAVGVAWYISHERFMKPTERFLNKLKLRASYGLAGNDNVFTSGGGLVRFPYRGQVATDGSGYDFGLIPGAGGGMSNWVGGVYEKSFASPNLSWETERKLNVGIDVGLFEGRVDFSVDYFTNRRENILIQRQTISSVTGFRTGMYQNYGITINKGVDANFIFKHQWGAVNISARGNVTYAKNEIVELDEITPKYSWMSQVGTSIGQQSLYMAERLYTPNDFDIIRQPNGSELYQLKKGFPRPSANVAPGDIKYKDLNEDGIIDSYDKTHYSGFYSTGIPEIVYGFGLNAAWKGIFVGVFFQGVAKASASLIASANHMIPFAAGRDNGSARDILQDRWRADDPYRQHVLFPRLHAGTFEHNQLPSTWWMRDAGFLRLKNIEIGYEFTKTVLRKLGMENFRIYMQGNNVAVWDKIKYWDPEQGNANSGAKYPLCRNYTVGLEITY